MAVVVVVVVAVVVACVVACVAAVVVAVVVAEAEGHHHTYNCTVFAAVASVHIPSFEDLLFSSALQPDLSKTILLHQAYFLVFVLSPAVSLLQDLSLACVASSSLVWVYSQELREVEC